ncbi:unnamed protein product [Mytilus coruscus]|uniref:Endonuclease/exonuclease/phosphatase domain-containing protein n=1 Tax=Mytilus coruscus TaxID=42192 RepID=A0A6J7ZY18_MYTCO|nr:unnamed protein product [Mytilus coruscus]
MTLKVKNRPKKSKKKSKSKSTKDNSGVNTDDCTGDIANVNKPSNTPLTPNVLDTTNTSVIRLEQCTKSLDDHLDQIEKSTQLISDEYDTHKQNFTDIKDIKAELNKISSQFKTNNSSVNTVDKKLSESLDVMKRENDRLRNELLEVQMKAMSNNLIFYNIPEVNDENCRNTIGKFCEEKLKIENPSNIVVTDAYRLDLKEKGTVFVCGDLNSRIGETNDFLYNDDLDKYIESVEQVQNPIISNRSSMDKFVNSFGRKLLQMCYDTGLTAANGRLGNDKHGNFTFRTANGRSVNDYLLVSPCDYELISNFEVLQLNEFSDHSPLYFELDFTNNRPSQNIPKFHTYIKWDNNKNIDYIQLLHNQQDRLLSLVNDISTLDDVNDSVRKITQILYNSAFEVSEDLF